MNNIFNIGDVVMTDNGEFTIVAHNGRYYACYQEGFKGHSCNGHFNGRYVDSLYHNQMWFFSGDSLTLVTKAEDNPVPVSEQDNMEQTKPEVKPKKKKKIKVGDLVMLVSTKHTEKLYGYNYYMLCVGDVRTVITQGVKGVAVDGYWYSPKDLKVVKRNKKGDVK